MSTCVLYSPENLIYKYCIMSLHAFQTEASWLPTMGALQQALIEPRDKASLAYLKRLTLSLIRVALADPVFTDFKTVCPRAHVPVAFLY